MYVTDKQTAFALERERERERERKRDLIRSEEEV